MPVKKNDHVNTDQVQKKIEKLIRKKSDENKALKKLLDNLNTSGHSEKKEK